MKDVAKKAGVHQTTVSLALKNNPRIPEQTRLRIQKIAKEMGYVPDPELNSLVSYRRNGNIKRTPQTIALVYDLSDPAIFNESEYLPEMKAAALKRAEELGYKIEIFVKGKDFTSSSMLNRVLKTRGIRGIIFGAIFYPTTQFELDWDEFSMIKINLTPHDLPIDSVSGNFLFSVRLAMRKIQEMGFQRPAMATENRDQYHTRDLYSTGFLFGQQRFKPENHIPFFEFERKPYPELRKEIRNWLLETRPDVFLSTWNNLSEVAWDVSVNHGLNCRFIGIEVEKDTRPYGGTRHNHVQIANTAVESLVGKMQIHQKGIPRTPSMTLINSEWITPGVWPPAESPYFKNPSFKELTNVH
jgi:LacI family transcriptional regulator